MRINIELGIAWIEQIVRIPYLCRHLLIKKFLDSISNWLWHKFEAVLTFILVCIKESGTFPKISVNLLDLWNFPAIMLLCLRKAIWLSSCLDFCFTCQCYFPSIAIKLLSESLTRLRIMVTLFVAVIFFPSFSLGRCEHLWRLLCKNTMSRIWIHHLICEQASSGTNVLSLVQVVQSVYDHVCLTPQSLSTSRIRTVIPRCPFTLVCKYVCHCCK